jgi:hypothetical protein
MTMDRRKVLARVKEAVNNGYSATRIGYLACGDPLFVKKLRDGHPFKPATLWRAFETIEEFDRPRYAWVAQGRKKTKVRKNAVLGRKPKRGSDTPAEKLTN